MKIETIILASASPRRLELLRQIGIEPKVVVSHVEEIVRSQVPEQVVMDLSRQKAEDVARGQKAGTLVIGSDTVVSADGQILGKPKTHAEAEQMIRRIAGRTHQVYTGVCLVWKQMDGEKDLVVNFFDETEVEVYPMSDEEIREYAESEEPMDKAGAYAVQGVFGRYIKGLKGSYANVMGLPISMVYQEMKKIGGNRT